MRTLKMFGLEVEDDATALGRRDTRALTYSITGGIPGLDRHEATITVHDAGGGCRVTWDVDTDPDTMLELMTGAYDGALKVLKDKLEG